MTVTVALRPADRAVLYASTTDLSAGRVLVACSADRWQFVCSVTCVDSRVTWSIRTQEP